MKLTEDQERWLAALESGQYSQGRHALCTADLNGGPGRFYCCLGVAEVSLGTEMIGPTFMDGRLTMSFVRREDGAVEESVRTALLSSSWRRLGLRSVIGELELAHKRAFDAELLRHAPELSAKAVAQVACLTSYNDKTGAPFKAIAAAIRAVPEAVFTVC